MAQVVSFSNQKGGVGKTTSCVNLACFVASLGYKTLLVDFDPQANATSAMGVFDKNIENSIYDAMSKRNAKGCIRKGKYADFIPSSRNLAGAELELSNENEREIVALISKSLTKSQILGTIDLLRAYRSHCTYNVGTGAALGGFAVELEELF